ncbi:MAG TPA: AraC family transcriptional regulator [Microscillaceae bacterium]|nr:AraC family transcriptional regulator [Microscillaceae bacterium]
MRLIPQRLLNQPFMQQILSDDASYILRKTLSEPALNREGYISKSVLAMVLKGEQKITTYDGNMIHIPAGSMMFIPKGMYSVSDLLSDNKGFENVLFFFDDSITEGFLLGKGVNINPQQTWPEAYRFKNQESVKAYLDALSAIVPKMNVIKEEFVRVKMYELLYLLEALDENFIHFLSHSLLGTPRNIKTFMEANYDKPLKVEDYAYLTGKSISTFRREFKTRFDTTPQKWLMDKRLTKAREMLVSTEISVTQVALETGYENVSHFIKEFKKKYQMTPKQVLIEHQEGLSL